MNSLSKEALLLGGTREEIASRCHLASSVAVREALWSLARSKGLKAMLGFKLSYLLAKGLKVQWRKLQPSDCSSVKWG